MDCGETLHVDSKHSKVCFCENEYAVVVVTKKRPCWKGVGVIQWTSTSQAFSTKKYTGLS